MAANSPSARRSCTSGRSRSRWRTSIFAALRFQAISNTRLSELQRACVISCASRIMPADTNAVRAEEQLDLEALCRYLDRQGFLHGERLSIEQFPGGHSNLTYLLKFEGGEEFVLRRPPLGPVAPKAHDMAREYRILRAVHPVFPPAPRPELVCEDTGVLGAPFYIMERRRGVVVRRENEIGNDT